MRQRHHRSRIAFAILTFASVVPAFAAIAMSGSGCTGSSSSCVENRDCPREASTEDVSNADAPVNSEGDAVISPPIVDGGGDGALEDVFDGAINGCAVALAPKDDACVLQDAIGVFVATVGSDSNPGTSTSPVASLAKAVELARGSGKPSIFVCGGTYTSGAALTIGQGSAISVYGGLSCVFGDASAAAADAGDASSTTGATWSWTGAVTKIAPLAATSEGAALVIDRVSGTSSFADLELQAPSALTAGTSSIGAFVRSCPDVRFTRVVLRAGDGAIGAKGADGNVTNAVRTKGDNASGSTGGSSVSCSCLTSGSLMSVGANGGGGGITPNSGGSGSPNLDGGAPKDGVGGGAGCSAGHEGANGRDGDAGAATAAATTFGSITFTGWAPTSNASSSGSGSGSAGTLAQGGGGGGGQSLGSGGGGGGCGGCGGQGGARGEPGGSSFALLAYQSGISLTSCTLFAGNGAAGGAGGTGQGGQTGADGGTGACAGGKGGAGGGGGGGAGGTGGISVAIGYSGTEPTLMQSTTVQPAGPGGGGSGGAAGGAGNAGQLGKAGTSAPTMSLP